MGVDRDLRPCRAARSWRSGMSPVEPACRRPSTSAAAKLARATTVRPDSQFRPPGQPPTLGGKNSSWPSRRAHSASKSVLGGGSKSSRLRTVPIAKATGSETWACRFRAEKNNSERRIVSTARPMCRLSAAIDRPAPRWRYHRRRSRRGTPGTAARPAAAAMAGWSRRTSASFSPSKRPVVPRIVLGPSSCQSGRKAYRP